MKKIPLILVLSLIAAAISFNVFLNGTQASNVGSLAIYQEVDWEKKYNELEANYAELNRTYYKLLNEILPEVESLRSSIAEMTSSLDTMRTNLDKMRSDLEASRSEYAALDVKYKSETLALSRELSTRTTMMYAFIVTTVVLLGTTIYLALKKRKA